MCGIAGILANHDPDLTRAAVVRMIDAQVHRGPNDAGVTVSRFGGQSIGLGHRRLAILDLTEAGHQPMVHSESGDVLVFNGQIYNFLTLRSELESLGARFRGHSDTEVLLEALVRWGAAALPRLQGMFAFAFLDHRSGRLMLARDSLGIKPLYLSHRANELVFGSEVRAVLASGIVPNSIDLQGVAGMLAYGAVQHPRTSFEFIRSFPPGHYQEFNAEGYALSESPIAFWHSGRPNRAIAPSTASDAIRKALEESVRDHLVADVPVGVFLSSGIDSTLMAGLAARHQPGIRSFTVGFADQPEFCEFHEAARTARNFGLQHTEISISNHEAEEAMNAWLHTLDQPSMDGLNTFVISRAVRREGIVVALSGLGGDELFGGYPSFVDVPRLAWTLGPVCALPGPFRTMIGNLMIAGKSEAVKDKFHDILRANTSLLGLYLQRRRALSSRRLERLGLEAKLLGLNSHYLPDESIEAVPVEVEQPFWSISQFESRFYMGNMLLRDSDTNSMAHGLELRVPMLAQPLVDLMATVPDTVRLPNGKPDKHLLRSAFGSLLHTDILKQGKRGFTLPIRRWIVGPLREQCEHSLRTLKGLQLLRNEGVDEVWKDFLAEPESPMWSRAFALVVLGHFLEQTVGGSNG